MPHHTAKVYSQRTQIADIDLRLTGTRALHKGANIDPYIQEKVREDCPFIISYIRTYLSQRKRGGGAVAISLRENRKLSLSGIAFIYTAKLHAIRCTVEIGKEVGPSKILIYSDSLTAIKAVRSIQSRNELVCKIQ